MFNEATCLKSEQKLGIVASPQFHTSHEAWLASLLHLYKYGSFVTGISDKTSIGSHFGESERSTQELLGTSFSITSPRNRIMHSEHRPLNISYAIANTIWVLTGANDLEMISFYNARGKEFSDDNLTVPSAPGKRIFTSDSGNQFERVVEKLREDCHSRRAYIQILLPSDILYETRDVSCVISLQFLVRDSALCCITYMRSQSALMLIPYDIFLFTMLQETVAVSLGIEVGHYYHICGSLHYYNDEEILVKQIIESQESNRYSPLAMPPMKSASDVLREDLAQAERDIRNKLSIDIKYDIDFNQYQLDSYWTELLRVMVASMRLRNKIIIPENDWIHISEPYRQILLSSG